LINFLRKRWRKIESFNTGGTGFIGAHLAAYLLKEKNTVHICDNNIRGSKDVVIDDLIAKGVTYIKCDVTNSAELFKLDKDYDIRLSFSSD